MTGRFRGRNHNRFAIRCFVARVVAVTIILMMAQDAMRCDAQTTFSAIDAHAEYVYCIRFSADGQRFVTASGDNTAIVWDAAAMKSLAVLEHDAAVYSADITTDGRLIATGTGEGVVTLWNADTGRPIVSKPEHQHAVYCVELSPDNRQLATAGGSTNGGDTTARLWNVPSLEIAGQLAGHARQIYGITWSPDGRILATSSSDKTIRLWKRSDRTYQELNGHTSDVYRCGFSPDGCRLSSASQDGTVRVWNVASGHCESVVEAGDDPVYDVCYTDDGKQLAAVSGDGRVRIWQANNMPRPDGDDVRPPATSIHPFTEHVTRSSLYAVEPSARDWSILVAGEDGKLYVRRPDRSAAP